MFHEPHEAKNPRVVLEEDHRQMDRLLGRLLAAVRADDREAEQHAWARFEKAILAHLDVEEMFIFPALGASCADEIAALRREHDALRRDLGALGIAFELHTVRAEAVEALCASLRAHAAREQSLAYPTADANVSAAVVRSILRRLENLVGLSDSRTPTRPAAGGAA